MGDRQEAPPQEPPASFVLFKQHEMPANARSTDVPLSHHLRSEPSWDEVHMHTRVQWLLTSGRTAGHTSGCRRLRERVHPTPPPPTPTPPPPPSCCYQTTGKVIKQLCTTCRSDRPHRAIAACAIISSRKNRPAASRQSHLAYVCFFFCFFFRDIVKVNNHAATPLISAATSDPHGRGFSEKKSFYPHCFCGAGKAPDSSF